MNIINRSARVALAVLLSVSALEAAPKIHPLNTSRPATSSDHQAVSAVVQEMRARAQSFVFLSGGASKMSDDAKAKLLALFDAFRLMHERGVRFAVADGGTNAGIMAAAGQARAASGNGFDLLGICPAADVTAPGNPVEGKTELEPNHSDIVTVTNPSWGGDATYGTWGSETAEMYVQFAALAAQRPSVTVVANGGGITVDEVAANVQQGRKMIVIKGSGRAAEAICALLSGQDPAAPDADFAKMKTKCAPIVEANKGMFVVFDLNAGPAALADLIASTLAAQQNL